MFAEDPYDRAALGRGDTRELPPSASIRSPLDPGNAFQILKLASRPETGVSGRDESFEV